MFEYRNDGYIELVLKVMARMCDGQNKLLQVIKFLVPLPGSPRSYQITPVFACPDCDMQLNCWRLSS